MNICMAAGILRGNTTRLQMPFCILKVWMHRKTYFIQLYLTTCAPTSWHFTVRQMNENFHRRRDFQTVRCVNDTSACQLWTFRLFVKIPLRLSVQLAVISALPSGGSFTVTPGVQVLAMGSLFCQLPWLRVPKQSIFHVSQFIYFAYLSYRQR